MTLEMSSSEISAETVLAGKVQVEQLEKASGESSGFKEFRRLVLDALSDGRWRTSRDIIVLTGVKVGQIQRWMPALCAQANLERDFVCEYTMWRLAD